MQNIYEKLWSKNIKAQNSNRKKKKRHARTYTLVVEVPVVVFCFSASAQQHTHVGRFRTGRVPWFTQRKENEKNKVSIRWACTSACAGGAVRNRAPERQPTLARRTGFPIEWHRDGRGGEEAVEGKGRSFFGAPLESKCIMGWMGLKWAIFTILEIWPHQLIQYNMHVDFIPSSIKSKNHNNINAYVNNSTLGSQSSFYIYVPGHSNYLRITFHFWIPSSRRGIPLYEPGLRIDDPRSTLLT